MMLKRLAHPLLTLGASLSILGCTALDMSPSQQDARQLFEETVSKKDSDGGPLLGSFRLSSFAKTDGLSSEADGKRIYRFDYEAVLEYPEGNNTFCLDNSSPPPGKSLFSCLLSTYNVQSVGAMQKLHGSISFVKTEKGWTPDAMTVKCERGHMSHEWCSR